MSSYWWLEPVEGATTENAAVILAKLHLVFTTSEIWQFDQRPHFIENILKTLAADYRILHKSTVAYSSCASDTVQSLMLTVLAALRPLMLKLKLAPQDWKEIIASIPTILTSTRSERLGSNRDGTLRSPLQIMMSIIPNRPVTRMIPSFNSTQKAVQLTVSLSYRTSGLGHWGSNRYTVTLYTVSQNLKNTTNNLCMRLDSYASVPTWKALSFPTTGQDTA